MLFMYAQLRNFTRHIIRRDLGSELTNLIVNDALLVVGEGDEPGVQVVELRLAEGDSQLLAARPQRVATAVLSEDQPALGDSDRLGIDDLVGGPLLEEAVLVDAGLVREGVAADDRLVRLNRDADDLGQQLAGRKELRGLDASVVPEGVAPRLQDHHDLLERAVACALADAVDGAFDLA